MDAPTDDTCNPSLRSWVGAANTAEADFPLQNLPLGIVREKDREGPWRIATAIGDQVLDVTGCVEDGLLDLGTELDSALRQKTLNALVAHGSEAVGAVRRGVQLLLGDDAASEVRERAAKRLVAAESIEHASPVAIGNFTDFFASLYHATNVVRLRNAEASLPSNYAYAPIAYHGRATSVVVSGTAVTRPQGPRRDGSAAVYAPTERLDFEAEVGLFVGPATTLGTPVPVTAARSHLVGVCLVNDWSARDIQSFESQPLGPFLSKSFVTSISPWMITMQALEPFRVAAAARREQDGQPLSYLLDAGDQARGAWGITVDVLLTSRAMREMDMSPLRLARANTRALFWTPAQLLAHHTSNGCNLLTGDLIGTGTVSGPDLDSRACLLEITRGGREPLTLPTGETRGFLHDEDEVTLRAHCSAPGARRIGFGECRGRVMPAVG